MRPPRMTVRRWMIAVAVIGIEAGLIIGPMRELGIDPATVNWAGTLAVLVAFHALVFMPAGIALLIREKGGRRSRSASRSGTDVLLTRIASQAH